MSEYDDQYVGDAAGHVPTGPNGRSFAPVQRARRQRQPLTEPAPEMVVAVGVAFEFRAPTAWERRQFAYQAAGGVCGDCRRSLTVRGLVSAVAPGTEANPVPRLTAVCRPCAAKRGWV